MSAAGCELAWSPTGFLPRLGGIELHMSDLARELNAQGCTVEIHSTVPGPSIVRDVAVHRTPALLAPYGGFAISPRLLSIIRREQANGRYEIVHAHLSIISPLAYAALYAAHQLRLPAVATFHSVLAVRRNYCALSIG